MKKLLLVIAILSFALVSCATPETDMQSSEAGGSTELVAPGIYVPTPAPSTAPETTLKGEVLIRVTNSDINIRTEPNTETSEILGKASYDEHFPYTENLEIGDWYQITYKNETAYISSGFSEIVWVEETDVPLVMSPYAYAQDETSQAEEDASDVEGEVSEDEDTSSSEEQESSSSEEAE